MSRFLVVLAAALLASSALAIDQEKRFDDPVLQARYEKLISEVRCLQCQNQSIKDSNVSLAADLRREIARMIDEGQSDAQIAEFLVVRYGEFALYRPRTTGKTLFKSAVRNFDDRIGLDKVEYFSSAEGIPVHADHEYELVSTYNNTTDQDQDSMAVMLLYMLDKEFRKRKPVDLSDF